MNMLMRGRSKTAIFLLVTYEALHSGVINAEQVHTLNDIPSLGKYNTSNAPAITNANENLYLLVSVNKSKAKSLINVRFDKKSNSFFIQASDLKSLRIQFPHMPDDNSWVNVGKISGVKVLYVVNDQLLDLTVPQDELSAYQVILNGGPKGNTTLLKRNALTAAILNYNLYNTYYHNDNYISGNLEGLLNTSIGNFYTSGIYNNRSVYGTQGAVRLNSYWQYIDAEKIRTYTLGDFTSNTVNWNSSVRLAGFQWASAYSQRSDLVTTALPQFSGSAAVASSLDLFVDQQKIYSGDIPSGAYDIKMLPFVSGNDVTIVTKDANGQQVSSTHSYYYSSAILQKGINEFSVDVGVPRFNYASKSSDYDDNVVFLSGATHSGLTNTTTLTLNGESATDDFANAGVGISQVLFGRGVVGVAVAGSHFKDQTGTLGQVSLEGRISHDLTFNSSYQKSSNNYYDLGKVSNYIYRRKYEKSDEDAEEALTYSSQATEIDRAGLNYSPFINWSFGSYYNRIVYPGSTYNLVSLNANTGVIPRLNISANVYKNISGTHDVGGYLILTYNFANDYNISSSVSHDSGNSSYTQQIDKIASSGIDTTSWGASTTHNTSGSDSSQVYGTYHGRYGTYNASVEQYGSTTKDEVSTSGSIVLADGGIFPTNTVGESFAIVKNAGPNTHILNGGVDLGAADSSGHFLINDMTPYTENHIFLDTTNLPIDWQTQDTEKVAISGYRQGSLVDFKGEKVISALALLVDKNNKPLPPGYKVELNNQSESITGYGGEVYLEQLKHSNTVTVNLLDKGTCVARFNYAANTSSTLKIGPYLCQ